MEHNLRLLTGIKPGELLREFSAIGVSREGIEIMKGKGDFILIKVDNLTPRAANILKQEMLAKGGEVALGRDLAYLEGEKGKALIMGTKSQYDRLISVLYRQPFKLSALAAELEETLKLSRRVPPPLVLKGRKFEWGRKTYIMGIINVTPDSFSGDGILLNKQIIDTALRQAERFAEEGADILDIGGESTRPGAAAVETEEEKKRILPVIEVLAAKSSLPVSVDTYKAAVAKEALAAGADMINDVWGLQKDPEMAKVAADFQVPVIVMHNKEKPGYEDLMAEVTGFLRKSIKIAKDAGLSRDKIIVDPGIGFGKTREDNLTVIDRLEELKALGTPVLLGTSRKSVIGLTLDLPVDQRVEGTAATIAVGIARGADIVRVHDVKEMSRVARMTDAIVRRP